MTLSKEDILAIAAETEYLCLDVRMATRKVPDNEAAKHNFLYMCPVMLYLHHVIPFIIFLLNLVYQRYTTACYTKMFHFLQNRILMCELYALTWRAGYARDRYMTTPFSQSRGGATLSDSGSSPYLGHWASLNDCYWIHLTNIMTCHCIDRRHNYPVQLKREQFKNSICRPTYCETDLATLEDCFYNNFVHGFYTTRSRFPRTAEHLFF